MASQPESKSKLLAERLLLLTDALFDAVANDRTDEIEQILSGRATVLAALEAQGIDESSFLVLLKVAETERNVQAVIERTSETLSNELVRLFSGNRNAKAYNKPAAHSGFLKAS